ncbi:hypothetical protein [Sphingomonas morindae]|uniref:Uncharacterized protein n=1 Tax=Sphingomonas morindae TaxID=1541170 RepID=A0ABY4XD65_9SPHN|nr:hypothetical protein [Sphingomonas morindae]USI74691.1 hypothetical protein LHA26_18245 [Sphingomonas morindae]
MDAPILTPVMRILIEMALTARGGDEPRRRRQDAEARRLGVCGAEIDAARDGRSFDAINSQALDLARAAAGPDSGRRRRASIQARKAGLTEAQCREIEIMAAALSPTSPP